MILDRVARYTGSLCPNCRSMVFSGRKSRRPRAAHSVAKKRKRWRADQAHLDRESLRLQGHRPKPRDNTNDFNPIWVGDTTFLSDGTVSSRCLPTTSNHNR